MPGIDMSTPSVTDGFVHEWPSSRVVFGAGTIAAVAGEAARYGTHTVIINDPAAGPAADRVAGDLGAHVGARITDVVQHVPASAVAAAVSTVTAARADVLVCLGGGSATGLAKGIARELPLPVIAVPTTYAGSEMTSIWGITENNRKTTGRAPSVRPRTVIYDPELTTGLPVALTVTSGVNATAHCVEALYAKESSPLTRLAAAEGIRSMAAALRTLVDAPRDTEARALALRGAWLSGWALEVSSTGLHHKLCHILGGLLDLPHSPLHTVLLPYVVGHVAQAAPAQTRLLLDSMGLSGPLADAGKLVWQRHTQLRAPLSLAEIGMHQADLDRAVTAAVAGLADVTLWPRSAGATDLRGLITAAWHGECPATN